MRNDEDTVRMVLNAQMGKDGPPMQGKDLHIGDFDWGVLPASAPLAISTLTLAGMALAFARERSSRVAVSYIGEGGASLGEWHEAINLCAARRLPAVFCIENNQTALSTPVPTQSAVRVFADKALAYGVPGFTIDGTDPDEIAAAFAWAADRARAGLGPTLIELVAMRMCGHAHHDDMLYLGKEPPISWEYPSLARDGAYADRELYAFWSHRDPIGTYAVAREGDGGEPACGPAAVPERRQPDSRSCGAAGRRLLVARTGVGGRRRAWWRGISPAHRSSRSRGPPASGSPARAAIGRTGASHRPQWTDVP